MLASRCLKWGAMAGAGGLVCAGVAGVTDHWGAKRVANESRLQPEPGVDPLPETMRLGTTYDLVGQGVRNVSFLKFKVYLLGVYLAREDQGLLRRVFNSKYLESFYEKDQETGHHVQNLEHALRDPSTSDLLWGNALGAGVRFAARICALRNTDLSHLRDGFVRTITNSPACKALDTERRTELDAGLADLRAVFNSYRANAKKNSLVYMELNADGSLDVSAELWDGKTHSARHHMGTVAEPLVGRILFTSYLSANKPLVQDVHLTSVFSVLSLF